MVVRVIVIIVMSLIILLVQNIGIIINLRDKNMEPIHKTCPETQDLCYKHECGKWSIKRNECGCIVP